MAKRFKMSGLWLALVGLLLMVPVSCWAGGGASYPLGAEAFMAGAFPPPGKYLLNYSYFYTAEELKDDQGHDNPIFDKITVWADVLRGIWISPCKILGGSYGQHVFVPLLNVDLDFKVPVGAKNRDRH